MEPTSEVDGAACRNRNYNAHAAYAYTPPNSASQDGRSLDGSSFQGGSAPTPAALGTGGPITQKRRDHKRDQLVLAPGPDDIALAFNASAGLVWKRWLWCAPMHCDLICVHACLRSTPCSACPVNSGHPAPVLLLHTPPCGASRCHCASVLDQHQQRSLTQQPHPDSTAHTFTHAHDLGV